MILTPYFSMNRMLLSAFIAAALYNIRVPCPVIVTYAIAITGGKEIVSAEGSKPDVKLAQQVRSEKKGEPKDRQSLLRRRHHKKLSNHKI